MCLRSSFLLRFKLRELRRDEREQSHSEAKFVKGHLHQKYIVLWFCFCTYLCLDFLEVYLENRPKITFAILNAVQCVFFFHFLWRFFSVSKRTTCVVCFSWSFSSFSFSSSSAASGCGKETWQENKININSAEIPPPSVSLPIYLSWKNMTKGVRQHIALHTGLILGS